MSSSPRGRSPSGSGPAASAWGAWSTRTGLGTLVEQGKPKVEIVDGVSWLLETPLRAEFALVSCQAGRHVGKPDLRLHVQNFNPVMAMAANTVIAEADEIVPVGDDPARCGPNSRESWSTTSWSGPS